LRCNELKDKIYYFAYGSNLHPIRLIKRVPSAELVGIAKHPNHRLSFHKKGQDDSSKCNMFSSEAGSDLIYGAIYQLERGHKNALDKIEGKGFGYIESQIALTYDGYEYPCFTYLAQQSHVDDNLKPYHWYKKLVILGAQYLEFPSAYISSIEAVESIEDLDPRRRIENETLIENIIYNR
jgi:gamma-glutamylcyclotransferase